MHDAAGGPPSGAGIDSSIGTTAGPADAADAAAVPSPARPLVGGSPIGVSRRAIDEPAMTDADAESPADTGAGAGAPPRAWTSVAAPGGTGPAGTPGAGPTSEPTAANSAPAAGPDAGPAASATAAATGTRAAPSTPGFPVRASFGSTPAARGAAGTSAAAGTSQIAPTAPASVPLVAARAIGSSPASSIASLGRRPADGPLPVVARLASGSPAIRAADATRGWSQPPVERLGATTDRGTALQREVLPAGARPTQGSGRAGTSTSISAFPLAYAATPGAAAVAASPEPGAVASETADCALGWTPATGFTSIATTPGLSVQRAVQIDGVTIAPDASAAGTAEAGAAAAGQAGGAAARAGGAAPDLEELADSLYDRIRSRLTSELLLDRERSGTLVDA